MNDCDIKRIHRRSHPAADRPSVSGADAMHSDIGSVRIKEKSRREESTEGTSHKEGGGGEKNNIKSL